MSSEYATLEDGSKVLHQMVCDGCGATLKPGPHVLDSGWEKKVLRMQYDIFTWLYCPECKNKR